ncbi:beta strand repeat-containing protein [Pseudobythopirellula maris]|uniref:beta strand repeat-containing protein n=1 Tax=Pseudobythopirellula maris TaxID=2527991 RepID=UPI0011B6F53E|nr:hypothetical protein [Pseudobythopirellula maris]
MSLRLFACLATIALATAASAQDAPMASGAVVGGPSGYSSSGMTYVPSTGDHIRARYNTQSYAQELGNLDIGTMRTWEYGDGMLFFDGQMTLNDESRVGYNVGGGYRWMTLPMFPNSPDDAKIAGLSIWADGSSTGGSNFFPQIGLSAELLGDKLDFRANAYIPVGPRTQTRDFSPTGELSYSGNFLGIETMGVRDTALNVGEFEIARRVGNLEAWGFAGGYGLSGGDYDAMGGKIGLRGYATPDLALQLALTNDDEFDTNAVFSLTWFIGRTRTDNMPNGTLEDRFREPVIRNDYVATAQDRVMAVEGLLMNADNEEFRIVHVDSTAGAGGDGTFENPYGSLAEADAGSMSDDIILAHAGSAFANDQITLQEGQRLLGEGLYTNLAGVQANVEHTITDGDGETFTLPETATNAFATAAPTVDNTGMAITAITLGDGNEVNNFNITGGTTAVGSAAYPGGGGDPTIRNLVASSTTGNGIDLNSFLRTDPDSLVQSIEFNVLLDEIQMSDIGGIGIAINGNEDGDTSGSILRNESIAISNVGITGGAGVGMDIRNTDDDTITTIDNYEYDGGTTGLGAMAFTNIDGPAISTNVVVTNSTLTGGATGGVATGVAINSSAGNFSFDGTNSITNLNGTTFAITGDGGSTVVEGDVTVGADITNSDGLVAEISDLNSGTTDISFTGDIVSDNGGEGISVHTNRNASVAFSGDVSLGATTQLTGVGVDLDDNGAAANADAASVNFTGGLAIRTNGATGFQATGGGTVGVAGDANTINSATGIGLDLGGAAVNDAVAIDATNGLNFDSVSANNAANGIRLRNVTGGAIAIGADDATGAEGGTIGSTTGAGVLAHNVADATFNGVTVTSSATNAFEVTSDNTDAMAVTINDSTVNSATGAGLRIDGTAANADNMTIAATNLSIGPAAPGPANGVSIANFGSSSTADFNNVDIANTTGDSLVITDNEGDIDFDSDSSITNTAAGARVVNITDQAGGTINIVASVDDTTGTGAGINVSGGTGGTTIFRGATTLTTTAATPAVNLNNTGPHSTQFLMDSTSPLEIDSTNGVGFMSQGTGSVVVAGEANTITSANAAALSMTDSAVGSGGVNFFTVDSTGAANGVVINGTTGTEAIALGNDTTASTLSSTAAAISVTNASNVDLLNFDASTTGATAIAVTGGADSSNVELTAVRTGAGEDMTVTHAGAGALTVTVNDEDTAGDSTIENDLVVSRTGTGNLTVNLDDVNVNGEVTNTLSGAGDYTLNTGGSTAIVGDVTTTYSGGGAGDVTLAIDDTTIGGNLTSSHDGSGDLTHLITGATTTITGNFDAEHTGTGDLTNTVNAATISGTYTAEQSGAGGGDVSNLLTNANINGAFSTSVSNAASTGALTTTSTGTDFGAAYSTTQSGNGGHTSSLTGGTVVGNQTAAHTGGALTYTLNNVTSSGSLTMTRSGNGASNVQLVNGSLAMNVDIDAVGSGQFDFLADNIDIGDNALATTALDISLAGTLDENDISITNSTLTAGDASALNLAFAGSNQDVRFELSNTDVTRNAGAAGDIGVIATSSTARLDATVIGSNVFSGVGAAAFQIANNSAGSEIMLNLDGASASGTGTIDLVNTSATPADFSILAEDDAGVDVNNRNNGDVTFEGAFPGNVADFLLDPDLDVTAPQN